MNSGGDRERSGFGGYGRWKHGYGGVNELWGYMGCIVMVLMSCEVTWDALWWYEWSVRLHGLYGDGMDELWGYMGCMVMVCMSCEVA